MNRFIVYALFIAVIIIWLFMPSKKKTRKKKVVKDQMGNNPVMIIDKTNALIDQMHNIRDSYAIKLNSLRADIVKCNDLDAMDAMSKNCTDMNHYCLKMDQLIEDMNELAKDQMIELIEQKYYELLEISDAMECAKEQLQYIVPHKQTCEKELNETEDSAEDQKIEYFHGCTTKEEIQKRYRALTKAFHPDTGFGDETSFQKMQKEYESVKNRD